MAKRNIPNNTSDETCGVVLFEIEMHSLLTEQQENNLMDTMGETD